ncbi:MAG: ABC transporter permease [Actinobacteria bacterium]|nr:MAG: ABC transporter permease [Actinomycetota bacterium]
MKAIKEIKEVEFISKEKALEIFIKRNQNNQALIKQIPGNPLPASYRVFLKDPHDVEKVAKRVNRFPEKSASIEDIRYGKEYVNKIFTVTRWLRLIALVMIIFLIFSALALISNTIRLAIYARRIEVAIMRLVGASNWFIRWPFFIEGIVEGLIGALLAISLLASVRYILLSKLETQMQFMSALQINPIFWRNLLIMLLGSGVIIGALGSVIALRRYLKV